MDALRERVRRVIVEALAVKQFPYVRSVREKTGASYEEILLIRDEVLRDEQLDRVMELAYQHGLRQGRDEEKSRERVAYFSNLFKEIREVSGDRAQDEAIYYRGILHIDPDVELTPALVRQRFNQEIRLFHPDANRNAADLRLINLLQEARDYLLARRRTRDDALPR